MMRGGGLLSYLTPTLFAMRHRCGCKKGKTPKPTNGGGSNGS